MRIYAIHQTFIVSRDIVTAMPAKREVTVACTQLSCTWDKEANIVRSRALSQCHSAPLQPRNK